MKHHLLIVFAFALSILGVGDKLYAEDFRDSFPDIPVTSPHGVSLQTGRFSFVETDLVVGTLKLMRKYDGKFSNFNWSNGYDFNNPANYSAHSHFDIGYNLRGYLYKRGVGQGVSFERYIVEIEGQSLTFQVSSNGAYRRWTIETRGWALAPSGSDFILRHKSGTQYIFAKHLIWGSSWQWLLMKKVLPDGTIVNNVYNPDTSLKSVYSSKGVRINFNYAPSVLTVCGFNDATQASNENTSCSSSNNKVQYNYTNGLLTSVQLNDNSIIGYQYNGNLISCIQFPNSSQCRIQNLYWPFNSPTGGISVGNSPDQVTRQILADGSVWNYEYDNSAFAGDAPPLAPQDLTEGNKRYTYGAVIDPDGKRTQVDFLIGFPENIWTPNGLTKLEHNGYYYNLVPAGSNAATPYTYTHFSLVPTAIIKPEGDRLEFGYDAAGNNIWQRSIEKADSVPPSSPQVLQRTYPAATPFGEWGTPTICYPDVAKLCDKFTKEVDAKGNETDYTYDPEHGGVLTETGPAVNGVRPQKRFAYGQFYPWIKEAGGSFVQVPDPIWLLDSESSCISSAATGNPASPCAAGLSDEVRVSYVYEQGSPTKGSNLLLLGTGVTAADETGQIVTRWTCHSYDSLGRKISETGPSANLTGCQ